MLVGSLVSGMYGQARLTHDIDVVVDLRVDQVTTLCQSFPRPDFYVSIPAATDAANRGGQFNVIHPRSANKVDFMIARKDAWGQIQLARRRQESVLPDLIGYVASAEDVILGKLIYYHEGEHDKHLRDIVTMLQVSGERIDRDYVLHWATTLGLVEHWTKVLNQVQKS